MPPDQQQQQKWYDEIVGLIPAESLAAFTSGMAFCVGYSWGFNVRLGILIGVAVFTPLWVFFNYFNALPPNQQTAKPLRKPWWDMSVGLTSFLVWSMTVPDTPLLKWHVWDLKYAPFVVFVAAIILAAANKAHTFWRIRHLLPAPTIA